MSVEKCASCGAFLSTDTSFCGTCGHTSSRDSHPATQIGTRSALQKEENPPSETGQQADNPSEEHQATAISNASMRIFWENTPTHLLPAVSPLLDAELANTEKEEEEEERRRRAALLGMALPGALLSPPGPSFTLAGTPPLGQMASLPGVPQLQPPMVAGTPTFPGPLTVHPAASMAPPPGLPHPGSGPGGPGRGNSGPGGSGSPGSGTQSGNTGSGNSTGSQSGCLMTGLIVLTALLVILGGTVTLGLTAWQPALTLAGNTFVTPGSTLTLHGTSFLPNSGVDLTLDNSATPLYYLQRTVPHQLAGASFQNAANASQLMRAFAQSKKTIEVQGNGTFTVSLPVDPTWTSGQHTIHANEALTHRSATLNFTITQTTATTTPTPGLTATPTPGLTATPTAPPGLSCATPGSLTLGPVSEKSSQTANGEITLCSSGSGQVHWQANWGAAWLQLGQQSGSLQAPASAQLTVTASAAHLAAGNYQTTITFTSPQSSASQTVQVTLTVQSGCVNTTPTSLSFLGVAGASDPSDSQSISVTNCGVTSNWSTSIATGSNWLSISPGHGTLAGGATGQIKVTASNLKAGLTAGSYTDTIVVTIGSHTRKIAVSLTVQAAPLISARPTSINGYYCNTDASGANYACSITLMNNSRVASLTWSATYSINGVSVQASSHTIAAGSSTTVTLLVPTKDQNATLTVTFNGPGNSVTVQWFYQIIIT